MYQVGRPKGSTKSTKVEIFYMYQEKATAAITLDLQKQKSFICIRVFFFGLNCFIYKSRNLLYVLGQSDPSSYYYLQKQKSFICIRLLLDLLQRISTKVEIFYMYQVSCWCKPKESTKVEIFYMYQAPIGCFHLRGRNLQKQKSFICIRYLHSLKN